MNEPISNNPDERGLLPYPVILAATKGDPEAMKIVVQHYASYIAYLSTRKVRDEYGNVYYGIDEDMPHIRFHDLRHTAATNMHQLTGDFYTVGEVLGHTLAGIGVSLGLSMNFEAVTARYVDVRLERKKEVLDAYHGAVKQADPAKAKEAEPKKAKSAAKKKSSEIEL